VYNCNDQSCLQKKPCLFSISAIKKQNFPLPPRKCKGPIENTIGIKEISGEWERGNFSVFSKSHLLYLPCKGVHLCPELPLHEVNRVNNEKFNRLLLRSFSMPSYCLQLTKILTSEGHVFDQELAFCLLEGPFPIL